MYQEMGLLQTVVMVVKNVAGLTMVATVGIFKRHYVKAIVVTAVFSAIYVVF